MKDKIVARLKAAKEDPFTRGIAVGGAIGIQVTLLSAIALRVNFDNKGVYIPENLIDYIYETGLPVLCNKAGRQVCISAS